MGIDWAAMVYGFHGALHTVVGARIGQQVSHVVHYGQYYGAFRLLRAMVEHGLHGRSHLGYAQLGFVEHTAASLEDAPLYPRNE